jgi:hypothetical protein
LPTASDITTPRAIAAFVDDPARPRFRFADAEEGDARRAGEAGDAADAAMGALWPRDAADAAMDALWPGDAGDATMGAL